MVDRSLPRGGPETPRGGLRNLDAARIATLRELDALAQVADVFLEDVPHLIEQLRRDLDRGDFSAAEKTAHRLKGSSANVGATDLSASFRRLEALAREWDPGLCRNELERAEAQYRAVAEELAELRAGGRDP